VPLETEAGEHCAERRFFGRRRFQVKALRRRILPHAMGARAGMQRDGRRIPFQFSCYAVFAGVDVAGREPPETVNHFVAANVLSKRSTLRSLARSPANPPYALLLTHSASISAASRWPGSLLPPSVAPPGSPAGSRQHP